MTNPVYACKRRIRVDLRSCKQVSRGRLSECDRLQVKARMRRPWRETDYSRALEALRALADELERHPPRRRQLAA
jgi:hypothetical protein